MFVVQVPPEPEAAPLILESEYFPRPSGYDGYCMLGQDEPGDSRAVLVEAGAGLLISPSIEIESLASQSVRHSVVHSHWSRNVEARLSLVESFSSDAGASSLMP